MMSEFYTTIEEYDLFFIVLVNQMIEIKIQFCKIFCSDRSNKDKSQFNFAEGKGNQLIESKKCFHS
jgi:hypothetical protein